MALIKCPECGKEFSDKAKACPNCAYPVPEPEEPTPEFPEFPNLLAIGDVELKTYKGTFPENSLKLNGFDNNDFTISKHKFGIEFLQISGVNFRKFFIHTSQIYRASLETTESIKNKSVIGRAAVGTILLGPLGGIVGGLSGIGSKTKKQHILVIDFFDIYTHSLKSILILSNDDLTILCNFLNTKLRTNGNCNYICNLLGADGKISDDLIVECSNKIGTKEVYENLLLYNFTSDEAHQRLQSLSSSIYGEIHNPNKSCSSALIFFVIALAVILIVYFMLKQ